MMRSRVYQLLLCSLLSIVFNIGISSDAGALLRRLDGGSRGGGGGDSEAGKPATPTPTSTSTPTPTSTPTSTPTPTNTPTPTSTPNCSVPGYAPIRTLSDFNNMRYNPSQNYILCNDLDFLDANVPKIYGNFTGIFDGNNWTLHNITRSDPLFEVLLAPGAIKNLKFKNMRMNGISGDKGSPLVGVVDAAEVSNLQFEGVSIAATLSSSFATVTPTPVVDMPAFVSIGFVAASAKGSATIRNITLIDNDSDINNVIDITNDLVGPIYPPTVVIGGVVGWVGVVRLENISARGAIDIHGTGRSIVGGVIGVHQGVANAFPNIVGVSFDGTINNYGSGTNLGGIAGLMGNATVTKSYAQGTINGGDAVYIGGLFGSVTNQISASLFAPQISDCFSDIILSPITAAGRGGIVGAAQGLAAKVITISNTYVRGTVPVGSTIPSGVAAVVGYGANYTVTSSYYDQTLNPTIPAGGGIPKSTTELQQLSTYSGGGWSISDTSSTQTTTWEINDGSGFPIINSE